MYCEKMCFQQKMAIDSVVLSLTGSPSLTVCPPQISDVTEMSDHGVLAVTGHSSRGTGLQRLHNAVMLTNKA